MGQTEQLSNALALGQLGHATVTARLEVQSLAPWLLQRPASPRLRFPDVAGTLAAWLAAGAQTEIATLQQQLWQDTHGASACPPSAPPRAAAGPAWSPDREQVTLGNLAGIR
jgi:hypothetical protein